MIGKVRKTRHKVRNFNPFRKSYSLRPEDVANARRYIRDYWPNLIRSNPNDRDNLVGLPNPFLVPSFVAEHEFDYDEMYYWDSYFMVQGMLDEEHKDLVMGILDNLVYLFERFKIIPNASRLYLTSRSQPPLLTSFIWDVYDAYSPGEKWLARMIKVAEQEYQTVWMGTRKPNARQVYRGLSRYYDFNYLHDIAEAESGWDMTPRFGRKCLNYLAIDLNALLYKYETDFARYYKLVGDKAACAKWQLAAKNRRNNINDLMWHETKGLYYDYDYVKARRGTVSSLAGYYPLWAGMVDEQQALKLAKTLRRFEHDGGLATTDAQTISQMVPGAMPTQWAYPNGWAPLHLLVIQGLERYGYHDEARRIAHKWLKCNLDWFNEHGIFLEKYNVVQTDKPPQKGVYPSQTGFGWTNAVFERLCRDYVDER